LGVNVSDDWNFEQIRATGFNKSAAVRVALHANSLVGKPGEHPISLWDQFSQNDFPRQPTLLSYGTNQAVGFRRQSSQFLDGGSMTLAFSGGMTAIARFKMTGNANSWERIFDFGKGEDNDNVMLTRQFESSKLEFSIRNSNQFVCELVVDNVLVQEEWMTIAVRYDDALNKVDMLKNGNVLANVSCSSTPANRDVSKSYVGKSNWASDATTSMDLAGLLIIEDYLNNDEVIAAGRELEQGGMRMSFEKIRATHLGSNFSITISGDDLNVSQPSMQWSLYGLPGWKSLGSSHKEECTITAGAGVMPQFAFAYRHCTGRSAHFIWLGVGIAPTAATCAAIVLGRPDCASKENFVWAGGSASADRKCGCFTQGSLADCVWQDPPASGVMQNGFLGGVDVHFLLQPEGQMSGMEVRFEITSTSKTWLQQYDYALNSGGRLLTKKEAVNHLIRPLTGSSEWVAIVNPGVVNSGVVGQEYVMAGTDGGAVVGSTRTNTGSSNYVLFMAPTYSLTPAAQDTCVRPSRCTFPFQYNKKGYGQCTMDSRPGRFWCGLVHAVDKCLSTIDKVSAVPNFKLKKDLTCIRQGFAWLAPGGSAPYTTASAAMCAQVVLENPACKKDAFKWAGKPDGDWNCGCWVKTNEAACTWEMYNGGTVIEYELEAVQDLDPFEAGKGICWTDCDPYDAPSAANSNCSSCPATLLDLHSSALSQLPRNSGVGAWGRSVQTDAALEPLWWPDGDGLKNTPRGACSSASDSWPASSLWQVSSRGRTQTNLQCCENCPGGTSKCYDDCSCMCSAAQTCGSALENGRSAWCLAEHGCETINGACVNITGRTDPGDSSSQGFVAFNGERTEFLDAGPTALNMHSAGGLTIVAVIRFRSIGAWERIVEFTSETFTDNVYVSRSASTSKLRFEIRSPASPGVACVLDSDEGTIVEGEWMTIVARYSAAMNSVDLLKDGRSASWRSTFGAPKRCDFKVEDRTVKHSYIGRPPNPWDEYLTADIKGIQVVSQYLGDAVAAALGESLSQGYGNACCGPALPAGPAGCHQCPQGKYHWGAEYSNQADKASRAYREYGFDIDETRTANADYGGFAELRFYDATGNRLFPSAWSNPGGNNPYGHTAALAFDEDVGTKWLDGNRQPLIATFNTAVQVASYEWISASDGASFAGRNPVSWLLKARDNATLDWEILGRVVKYPVGTVNNEHVGPFWLFASNPSQNSSALVADSARACVDYSVLRSNNVVRITSMASCLAAASFRHSGQGLRTEVLVAYGSAADQREQVNSYLVGAGGCISVSECQGLSTSEIVSRCQYVLAPQLRSDGKGVFGSDLYSPAKTHRLSIQDDGNLVLYQVAGNQPLWSTGTQAGNHVFRAILQADGNFVRYHKDGGSSPTATWNTGTSNAGLAPHVLRVENDGRLHKCVHV
jgi:hypothetical protein